ncbi:MAG TPA: shikimate dehydrogenase [Verrucomicrobiales bacterium]|nr:shikimate dehydrogenase [Verrucomicrobiales bacterium]
MRSDRRTHAVAVDGKEGKLKLMPLGKAWRPVFRPAVDGRRRNSEAGLPRAHGHGLCGQQEETAPDRPKMGLDRYEKNREVWTVSDLRGWTAEPMEGPDRPILSVFGDPVAHSLSPPMMNPALRECGIEGRYVRIRVKAGEFEEALRLLPSAGFAGTNVTIPHKFAALRAVDEVDALAVTLGAVNTVRIEGGGLWGSNSDGPGFLRALRECFGLEARDLRILLLGAGGGAGRAVAIQCALERCRRLVLVNRTAAKAENLGRELRALVPGMEPESAAWSDEALREALGEIDLIVNATSLGMDRADPSLVPAEALGSEHCVFDMVYRPLRTRLVGDAERRGARAINGLSMLLHQGVISFETWFGREAPLETMRSGLERAAAALEGESR